MVYKERVFKCVVCGTKFISKQKSPKTCSKSCKMKLMDKQLKEIKINTCEHCGKEFEYKTSKRHPIHRFCSQECRHKHHIENLKTNGLKESTKNKISEKLKGRSLKDRGFSDEAISDSVEALKNAGRKWNDSVKGKTYEEIYGEEKAKKLKKQFSENRIGSKNSFYNKKHTKATKNKIVRNRNGKFYNFVSGTFNNVKWQGSYELGFLIYCYENKIRISRYFLEPIEYIFRQKKTLFPRF